MKKIKVKNKTDIEKLNLKKKKLKQMKKMRKKNLN